MLVTVDGMITSIERDIKDNKEFTKIMLAQKGQKEQVAVRVDGNVVDRFTPTEMATFTGRLFFWKQREGIGSMVQVVHEF